MGYLVEFYINTDGDFSFRKLDEFKSIKLSDEVFICDCHDLKSALSLIERQAQSIIETMSGSTRIREGVQEHMQIIIEQVGSFEKVGNAYFDNTSSSYEFEWENGNHDGCFRLCFHDLENVYETYDTIDYLLKKIGIDNESMLYIQW